jgi:monoamine oxidase
MARSPLMRALQALAREHQEASTLGLDVEKLRERRSEGRLSRRELIKRSGIVGAAVAFGGPAAVARAAGSPLRAPTAPRIAIVGGGIAGLTAALTLQDKGVAADVYESSSRVGGRMHSDWQEGAAFANFWGGQQAELCGELIDSNHKTILQLAQRFGLPTVDLLQAQPNGTEDTYWIFGADYPFAQASADFKPVHNTLQGQVQATSYPTLYNSFTSAGQFFDHMTLYDWIENYVPGGQSSQLGALLNAAYNEEYGAETTDQSALNLIYLLGYKAGPGTWSVYGASDERYHIVGGNSKLPVTIAGALARPVNFGYRMTSIAVASDGSVNVSFDNGKTVNADHVILCMHFAVLRKLNYKKANFDQLKQAAITQLGAGVNSKLMLQFDSRLWNAHGSTGSLYSDQSFQSGWEVTRGQSGSSGILVEYAGANQSRSMAQSSSYTTTATNANVTKFAQQFLAQLEPVFPGLTNQWNGKAMLSTPATDPNFLCSYSYWKPGQYVGFSGYEKLRQGNIHFAGEHCSQDFQGFMEGGAAEGARAATEILSDLKKL